MILRLQVNGDERELPGPATVADLLRELGLARSPCAVEVNRALVPHRDRSDHALHDGDRIEIVTLVGGG